MFGKFLSLMIRIFVWGILVYLFLGFIVIPMGLKWGLESQGSKILRHRVEVRSVSFNPVMFSLGISGMEILGADKQPLIALNRFSVDVSFLGLLKKIYRVESLRVDGLKVDVRLLSGGRINMLDLVPIAPPESNASSKPEAPSASAAAVVMPDVRVDHVVLQNGDVMVTDETVTPHFKTALHDIRIDVSGFSTNPLAQVKAVINARLDEKGVIAIESTLKPLAKPLELEASCTVNSYVLTVLSPYVGKYTGRALDDGKFDFRMDYRIANNKLTASHKILVQNFTFGKKVETKDALGLPFGLALALLEDANGQIKVSLPVTGDMSSPKFRYWPLVGQVIRDFFFKVVTKPFAFLGSMLGAESGVDELGYVRFEPGKSELSAAEKEKLQVLVRGLKERPKLRLEIAGAYDPEMDWRAIQKEVLAKEYEALRRESTGDEMKIYEQLYQRSFGVRDLWALSKKHKVRVTEYDSEKAVEEMKRQLVEKAPVDKAAMEPLAAARTQQVYDALIALGLDADKVQRTGSRAVQGTMGYVPLEFVLTVFDEKAK